VEPITEHDAPSGLHRQGGFTDPFGHRWSEGYTPHLNGFPSENRRRATGITLNVGLAPCWAALHYRQAL